MNLIEKSAVFVSVLIILLSGYSDILESLQPERLVSIETTFIYIEIIVGLLLVGLSIKNSGKVGVMIVVVLTVFALDYASGDINGTPIGLIFGFGPDFIKVVEVKNEPQFFTRYELVFTSAILLLLVLALRLLSKSHNNSSHSAS